MSRYWILFSIFLHLVNTTIPPRAHYASSGKSKSMPALDSLIASLVRAPWGADDADCLRATLDMLWGVKNDTLWAVWVWDSMQPPVGTLYGQPVHIGSYDQCLKAPWASDPGFQSLRTQYCLVDVNMDALEELRDLNPFDSAEEYYRRPSKAGNRFNKQTFGVCLPAVCHPSSVGKIFRHMHQLTHLPEGDLYVDPRDCQRSGEAIRHSRGFYGFWILMTMFAAIAVYSTIYNKNNEMKAKYADLITTSFCIRRNYNSMFKVNKDEIKVMNGLRFLTSGLIVIVHDGFYGMQIPCVNGLDIDMFLNTIFGISLVHLEVVVDTFFTMSGLLLVRGLLMGKQKNVVHTLVKRYIRLIVPMTLSSLCIATEALMSLNDGPLWARANRDEVGTCAKTWWRSLLMINNDVDTLCHIVSWYVACDFQLAILAVCLFCVYRRSRTLGAAAFMAVAAGLTLRLGWVVYHNRLDVIPFGRKDIEQFRSHTQLNHTYMNPTSRAGSYLVGMMMGYVITVYKPSEHRDIISKKSSVIITAVSLITNVAVISIGGFFLGRPYDPLEAAIAVASNRVVWAAGICCIIGACEYGSVPLVSDLLGWSGFVPLSKLSYCLYLVHPFIQQSHKFATRSSQTFGLLAMIINSCGVLVVGCIVSFLLHLMVEAPFINISNALFTKPPSVEQNGTKNEISSNSHSKLEQNGYEHNKAKIS